jgi:peptidoglycan/xylan/chitin deacetylase (PgdA/CDA1 family)
MMRRAAAQHNPQSVLTFHTFYRLASPRVAMEVYKTLVLCYHSVSEEWSHALAVTPRAFERQLVWLLRRGFRPVPSDELLAGGRRRLYVTFDDAYRDIVNALPILERLRLPATVFASTAFAENGRPLAVPELADQAAAFPERLATMSWDELRGVAERGFEIGSHTVSHPHLRQLSDAELDRELAESRARIEDELGRPCRLLAYPYGEHDTRVQEAARRNGYAAAFALWAGSSPTNLYALPRVDFYRRDSILRATLKSSFLKPHASAILSRLRARSAA